MDLRPCAKVVRFHRPGPVPPNRPTFPRERSLATGDWLRRSTEARPGDRLPCLTSRTSSEKPSRSMEETHDGPTRYVQRDIRPISLRQLTFFGRTLTERRLLGSANYVRTELPTRYEAASPPIRYPPIPF